MAKLVMQRIAAGIITIFAASLLIFICTEILPGDVASALLGRDATPAALAAIREALHLDLPAPLRFLRWIGNFLSGDLGYSLANNRPVSEALGPRLFNTMFLAFYTAVMAVPLATILAFWAAVKPTRMLDKLGAFLSATAISLPEFLIGYLLILVFAVKWHLFPSLANVQPEASLSDRLYLTFLPMLTLSCVIFSHIFRMTRAALLGEMRQAYVTMAELKGLSRSYILMRHVLPNATAPIVYAIALNLAHLVLGVVVVETIFVYPGLGQWMVDAVSKRDLPIVQALGTIFAAIFIMLNLLADLIAVVVNPRLIHTR